MPDNSIGNQNKDQWYNHPFYRGNFIYGYSNFIHFDYKNKLIPLNMQSLKAILFFDKEIIVILIVEKTHDICGNYKSNPPLGLTSNLTYLGFVDQAMQINLPILESTNRLFYLARKFLFAI